MIDPPALELSAARPKRLVISLQVLRAIAAYLVVLVHIGILFKDTGMDGYFHIASCGVDIFFVISGFIMVYTTSLHTWGRGNFSGIGWCGLFPAIGC